MPSKSGKQARLMAGAAHNPSFARKVGVPQNVAQDFNVADAKTGILRKKKKFRPGQQRRGIGESDTQI
jgi:hypothetical protein